MKSWLQENRHTSHQSVNDIILILGQSLLQNLFDKMKETSGPAWFLIIADEATDVVSSEQLNLTIHWNPIYSDQGYAHPMVKLTTVIMRTGI